MKRQLISKRTLINTKCNGCSQNEGELKLNSTKKHKVHLAMFAKYWEPGKVKTRLGRDIGNDYSCEIHKILVHHLLDTFNEFGDQRSLVCSPVNRHDDFQSVLPVEWDLQVQSDGNIGKRMRSFFRDNDQLAEKNILIGSDTPNIPVEYMNRCVEMLEDSDVVFGPSRDGGYYLVAMTQFQEIFDNIEWSTEQVLPQSVERCDQLGISYSLLPELNDVDNLRDLLDVTRELDDESTLYRELSDKLSEAESSLRDG